jgi:hypothetical protein
MLELGERKYDNYASEDRFPLTSCCATQVASQAKKRIFLSEYMAPVFAHRAPAFTVMHSIKRVHIEKIKLVKAGIT